MKRIPVTFNHGRQQLLFKVYSDPARFERRFDCSAWYVAKAGRDARNGLFGYIHLPIDTIDGDTPTARELVAHEVQHAMIDWVLCRAWDLQYLARWEEKIAIMTGDITRKFWRQFVV